VPHTVEPVTSGARMCAYSLNIHYRTYSINGTNTVFDVAVSRTHCCCSWLNFRYQGSQQRQTAY